LAKGELAPDGNADAFCLSGPVYRRRLSTSKGGGKRVESEST